MWKEILKSEQVQQGDATGLFLPERLNVSNRRDCCKEVRVKFKEEINHTFDSHTCEELYELLLVAISDIMSPLIPGRPAQNTEYGIWLTELKEEWDKCDRGELKAKFEQEEVLQSPTSYVDIMAGRIR